MKTVGQAPKPRTKGQECVHFNQQLVKYREGGRQSGATPQSKRLEIPNHVPPPLPQPTKKLQLAAAKRMEKELAKARKKGKGIDYLVVAGADSEMPDQPQNGAGRATASQPKQKVKAPKRKRKPANGPVMDTFKKFMAECKKEGMTHAKGLELWKVSDARAHLIDGTSPAERKRRRF